MQQLAPAGQRLVADLAQRYGVSQDAITHMLFAVLNGNGSMAQFSHPEFGGAGQWMRGGMTMVGDMFNYALKGRVDSLCSEISSVLNDQPGLLQTGSFQSQSQSGGGQSSGMGMALGPSTLFVPDPRAQWYPAELGAPNSTGSQNNLRYAYFANAHRLAVDSGGDVWVYDTLDHQIGGFSQQQGSGGSITLSSQYGTVNLSSLPVVSRNGQPFQAPPPPPPQPAYQGGNAGNSVPSRDSGDVFAAIERLADLRAKGILTDDEFAAKKAELLSRL
ncbi:MAG: SHOCT domain-containing protein [Rhodocyclaceae bacterium]|nr:SHOCT domain-containing protein [Rhodocyclaceae bacterium]MBX3669610.1 SHOCT domain-containing protein [Rhodocyclaceae bacterium]